ncbi:MAG: hypothetical protein ABI175_11870 [Polyangiales bacterium]
MNPRAAQAMLVFGALAIVFGVNVLRGAFFMGTYKTNDVMLGAAAGAIGGILIAIGAAGLGKKWIGLGVAVAILGGGAWYVLSLLDTSDHDRHAEQRYIEVEDRLNAACFGTAITEAAPLAELGHGIRKVLFLTKWDANNRPRAWVPDERWKPASVAETQLVGCLTTGSDVVETCSGTQNPISRRRLRIDARLVEARTGKVLSEHVTHGGLPAECSTAGDRSADLSGSDPEDDEILRWSRPLIVGAEAVP